MTQADTIQQFFSRFLTAYESTVVPEDAAFPRLTYNLVTGSWEQQAPLRVDLWYRSINLGAINAKADEIGNAIGQGGVILPCDGGALWVRKGSPFAQTVLVPDDPAVKRKYINVIVEFLTI